jgi:hypothetical protein
MLASHRGLQQSAHTPNHIAAGAREAQISLEGALALLLINDAGVAVLLCEEQEGADSLLVQNFADPNI